MVVTHVAKAMVVIADVCLASSLCPVLSSVPCEFQEMEASSEPPEWMPLFSSRCRHSPRMTLSDRAESGAASGGLAQSPPSRPFIPEAALGRAFLGAWEQSSVWHSFLFFSQLGGIP